jgi:Cu-Zn family superoxide dismutase
MWYAWGNERRLGMKPIRRLARAIPLAAALVLAGSTPASAGSVQRARATIKSCSDGTTLGTAYLVERPSSEALKVVDVIVSVVGLTPGPHAVHIHAVGDCTPPCSAAGSHLDLGPFGHNNPVVDNHPWHSGDLINIEVEPSGRGFLSTTTSRVAVSPDPPGRLPGRDLTLFDADGSSIMIHALPDLYCPDPADPNCAGGSRVACGVLMRAE